MRTSDWAEAQRVLDSLYQPELGGYLIPSDVGDWLREAAGIDKSTAPETMSLEALKEAMRSGGATLKGVRNDE